MKKNLKILVPVDFSRHSLETLDFAFTLSDYCQPELLVLHVVATGEVETFANLGGEPGEVLERRRSEALEHLEKEVETRTPAEAHNTVSSRVVSGVPFKEICRVAEEQNCGLIVIGTHGRTGLYHLLIGSTAERVVQHASCPVLSRKPRVL